MVRVRTTGTSGPATPRSVSCSSENAANSGTGAGAGAGAGSAAGPGAAARRRTLSSTIWRSTYSMPPVIRLMPYESRSSFSYASLRCLTETMSQSVSARRSSRTLYSSLTRADQSRSWPSSCFSRRPRS